MQLGVDAFTGKYGSEDSTSDVVLAGPLVAALRSHGQADEESCAAYGNPGPCPRPVYWIRVINVRTYRQAVIAEGVVAYSTLVLSRQGAVAWLAFPSAGVEQLEAAALDSQGKATFTASPITVDSGNVDRRSVHFVGRTLYWTRDGQQYQREISG